VTISCGVSAAQALLVTHGHQQRDDGDWDRARYRFVQLIAGRHGVVSVGHLRAAAVDGVTLRRWIADGQLIPMGVRSFALPSSPAGWRQRLAAAAFETFGVVAGRAAARLHGIDGFDHDDIEILARHQSIVPGAIIATPSRPLHVGDTVIIDGLRVVAVHRLLAEVAAFHLTAAERDALARAVISGRQRRGTGY